MRPAALRGGCLGSSASHPCNVVSAPVTMPTIIVNTKRVLDHGRCVLAGGCGRCALVASGRCALVGVVSVLIVVSLLVGKVHGCCPDFTS